MPIVEGHGDVDAVPILIRRLAAALGYGNVHVEKAIRWPRFKIVKQGELERAVRLALGKLGVNPGAILILLDAEDDCPARLGPELLERARKVAVTVPVGVVLAAREYEAWFLAALTSLRGRRGISPDAEPPPDPEAIRGAKEALEQWLRNGGTYSETVDQPALTAYFDLEEARERSPSFAKCWRTVASLLAQVPESSPPA